MIVNIVQRLSDVSRKSISYIRHHGIIAFTQKVKKRLFESEVTSNTASSLTRKEMVPWNKGAGSTELSNIFIVGCPRSGTSALSWAMAEHPALWTSAESNILLYLFRTPWLFEQYQRSASSQENLIWFVKHNVSYAEFASYIGKGLDLLFRSRSENKIWIDATPAYTNVVSDLMIYFPQAKFIHIVRDGRAVVNSMLTSGFSGEEFNNFELACKAWVHYVTKGLDIMQAFPDRVHETRNENLVSNPEKEFNAIYDFLGLKPCSASATFIRTKRINSSYLNVEKDDIKKAKDPSLMPKTPWKNWSPKEQQLFIKIAGETMTKLGYDLNFQ